MPNTHHLIDLAVPVEKAFLVAVDTGGDDGWSAEDSLAELASLASTAGADVVGAEWQNRRHVDPNWYVGKGKAEELVAARRETGFDVLVADDELSPAQQRSLEELLNVKVIDRSRLILDIFALHAQTHEGRLQVELAQLEYQLPRLTRLWTHLSRTQGGIGSRGPGESQLETDRRIIRTRISKMKERVEQVRQQRETAARGRDRRLWPTVGIVGYTNAGKSTLLNALVGSDVAHAEDKLFATLDPTSRQVKLGDGQTAIVTDTVGFIHKLPHQLVDAFRATLEEVTRADVLIEVVDASDEHFEEHRLTVQTVLDELGAGDKPRLLAFNKADLLEPAARDASARRPGHRRARVRVGADGVRHGHDAGRDRRPPRIDVGRRGRRRAVRGGRAARPRPRARRGGARIRRARRAGDRARRAGAGRRAGRDRRALGRLARRRGRGRDRDRRRGMTEPTRVAGWGRLADGSHVTWTVAEGRRGRRWREVVAGGPAAGQAVLLETAPDGRFSHLELARPDGLWTFHPEGDGTLHGNHVGGAEPGVRHVAGWPFGPRDVLLVEGSTVSAAAIAWAHRDALAPGASATVAGVVIGLDGSLAANARDRDRATGRAPLVDRAGDPDRDRRRRAAGPRARRPGAARSRLTRVVDGLWTTYRFGRIFAAKSWISA